MSFDDAAQDWVSVADDPSLDLWDAMTLSAWVRPRERRSWQTVLMKETPTWFSYQLYTEGSAVGPRGTLSAGEASGYKSVKGPTALPLDGWSHLAMTSDGTTQRLYVNGSQVASAAAVVAQNTDGSLRIGGNEVWGEHFDGLIDDVRVYDEALTAAEIQTPVEPPDGPEPPIDQQPTLALSFDDG